MLKESVSVTECQFSQTLMVVFHRFLEHCVLLAGTCLSDKVTAALLAESTTFPRQQLTVGNECNTMVIKNNGNNAKHKLHTNCTG